MKHNGPTITLFERWEGEPRKAGSSMEKSTVEVFAKYAKGSCVLGVNWDWKRLTNRSNYDFCKPFLELRIPFFRVSFYQRYVSYTVPFEKEHEPSHKP